MEGGREGGRVRLVFVFFCSALQTIIPCFFPSLPPYLATG